MFQTVAECSFVMICAQAEFRFSEEILRTGLCGKMRRIACHRKQHSVLFLYQKKRQTGLDFEVDQLTNSIQNVITEDSCPTDVTLISSAELTAVTKKNGWLFNWKIEFKHPERDVYKLTIVNNQTVIQGLICLEIKPDHVYVHLLESAPFNKHKTKIYSGVPRNLIAFACKLSFQRGHGGNVSFHSKTQLVDRYVKSLGATHFGDRLMIIETTAALKLIDKYFKD